MRQNTLEARASIRQHTSVFNTRISSSLTSPRLSGGPSPKSWRQERAYVSIRQHTSVCILSVPADSLGEVREPQSHGICILYVYTLGPGHQGDFIYCNKWKWWSMPFTAISDNNNILDCNKWHFNRFLNRCLLRVMNSLLLTAIIILSLEYAAYE
jgi:hypothetical protein